MVQAAASAGRVHRQNHVGTSRPDEAHVVADNLVPAPLLQRFFDAERIAEVDRAGEVLLGRIEAVHRLELFGSQHGECIVDLGADFILAAVAPSRRRENRAGTPPSIQVDVKRVVLVIRVRGRLHEYGGRVELAQHQAECDPTIFEIDRTDAQLGSSKKGVDGVCPPF